MEQRLAFIWDRLVISGRINKADVAAKFRISAAQCSLTFTRFHTAYPDAMAYDLSLKRYVPGPRFEALRPRLPPPPEETLAHYKALAAHLSEQLLEARARLDAIKAIAEKAL